MALDDEAIEHVAAEHPPEPPQGGAVDLAVVVDLECEVARVLLGAVEPADASVPGGPVYGRKETASQAAKHAAPSTCPSSVSAAAQ